MNDKTELPDKPERNRQPGLMAKAKDSLLRLSSKKKEIDDKYDQSIAAVREWENEQNEKLDVIEDRIRLRYDGTVIDAAQTERQEKLESSRQQVLEQIRREQNDTEDFSRRVEQLKLLKGDNKCRTEKKTENGTEEEAK